MNQDKKDNKLVFREEDHTYWLGDERLPSVTEIIYCVSGYDKVPKAILENASVFGSAVHDTIKLWLLNDLDEESLDDGLKKPLEGFIGWYKSFQKTYGNPLLVEKPQYHERLLYAGTPDIVFHEAIVDIKTRKMQRASDCLQLAAYARLVSDFPVKKLYVLEIDVEGNCNLVNAENKQGWPIFRKLLENYRSNEEIQALIENWRN